MTGTSDKEYTFHITKHDNTATPTCTEKKKKRKKTQPTRNKINHKRFVINSWRSGKKN